MLKLFRYLKKAYVPVIAIVLLLILQASCDLTLPTFTSNIVNVGIQQKGIEDAVPGSLSTRSLVFSAHPWDWLEVWQVNI